MHDDSALRKQTYALLIKRIISELFTALKKLKRHGLTDISIIMLILRDLSLFLGIRRLQQPEEGGIFSVLYTLIHYLMVKYI